MPKQVHLDDTDTVKYVVEFTPPETCPNVVTVADNVAVESGWTYDSATQTFIEPAGS